MITRRLSFDGQLAMWLEINNSVVALCLDEYVVVDAANARCLL